MFVLFAFAACHVGAAQNKPEPSDRLIEPTYNGQPLSHWTASYIVGPRIQRELATIDADKPA